MNERRQAVVPTTIKDVPTLLPENTSGRPSLPSHCGALASAYLEYS